MSWFFLRLHIKKAGFVRSLSYGPAKQYGFTGQITVAFLESPVRKDFRLSRLTKKSPEIESVIFSVAKRAKSKHYVQVTFGLEFGFLSLGQKTSLPIY